MPQQRIGVSVGNKFGLLQQRIGPTLIKVKSLKSEFNRRGSCSELPGDLSRPSLVGTSSPSGEPVQTKAGYPTVPEYRDSTSTDRDNVTTSFGLGASLKEIKNSDFNQS